MLFPADRAKFAEAMKAGRSSAQERSMEEETFDFEYRRSDLEARVKELDYAFQLRTEDVRDEPYWHSRREQFSKLCKWMLKRLGKANTLAELEAFAKDFQKPKMHYARTVGYLTLSDRIEQQRKALIQL